MKYKIVDLDSGMVAYFYDADSVVSAATWLVARGMDIACYRSASPRCPRRMSDFWRRTF